MAETDLPEEWRVVADFPDYAVSNLGRVRRETDSPYTRAGRILRQVWRGGYLCARLCQRVGTAKQRSVHILVCEAFYGPRPSPRHEAAHWDGHPINCKLSNLRWATKKENAADRDRHGHTVRGKRALKRPKLSDEQARHIRLRLRSGERQAKLASEFNVSQSTVSLIGSGRTWKWVTPSEGDNKL